jgi:hypothetical protein
MEHLNIDEEDQDVLMAELLKATKIERTCTLSQIKIKNVERWNTAANPEDFV